MTTFLKRLLFDDDRLRERTLTELVHAFETGRMIAFVGSMATESFGYGSWSNLVSKYVDEARQLGVMESGGSPAARGRSEALTGLKAACDHLDQRRADAKQRDVIGDRTLLSLAREALDHIDGADPLSAGPPRGTGEAPGQTARALSHERWRAADGSRAGLLDIAAAGMFDCRPREPGEDGENPESEPASSVVRALFRELRVHRFATLNYDLEIEAELMLEPTERDTADDPVQLFVQLRHRGLIRRDPNVSTRLSRLLTDGTFVESDIRDRERPDRLIDFAVGSALVDRAIMHLHGRATEPDTMIIGLRDYDRLYRKNDPARGPFEHGQRILFGGNPVLFVGTGMSEQEITWTLQDFVSNNPYRRFAPTFLLWGTAKLATKEKRWLKRIDFFRKFGVLTIFDDDLCAAGGIAADVAAERAADLLRRQLEEARSIEDDDARRALDREILARTVELLARVCVAHDQQLHDWGDEKSWRPLTRQLETPDKPSERKPITLWETLKIGSHIGADFGALDLGEAGRPAFRVVVATAGSGKGALAWKIVNSPAEELDGFDAPKDRRLIVNAGFALDSDFLLLAIMRFVDNLQGRRAADEFPRKSRETRFEIPGFFGPDEAEKALVIINGIERFFSVDGAPVSAELDHLFRRIARAPTGAFRWLFFGSQRIERYFKTIRPDAVVNFANVCSHRIQAGRLGDDGDAPKTGQPPAASEPVIWRDDDGHGGRAEAPTSPPLVRSVYFSHLIRSIEALGHEAAGGESVATFGDRVVLHAHRSGDPRALTRVVAETYVTLDVLKGIWPNDPDLAMEVLRALAFIGYPVEAAVLLHVPRVRDALHRPASGRPSDEPVDRLGRTLARLAQAGLLLEFEALAPYPDHTWLWTRYGLHTALSAELRRRVGVPLTESKLSTSFNMSLFVAQPVDSFVADPDVHDELGKMIEHLIGAYKDDDSGRPMEPPQPDSEESARAGPHATAAMRAALALVRSCYSTAGLLTLECDQRPPPDDRDGVLLEHAERLETLLSAFRKMRRARARKAEETGAGPEPFFAEDLVWLLNELGVVYLAQGDLYGARRCFDDALRVNRRCVEHDCRSHNWRRITMNRVLLEIERADLSGADQKLREIEASIDDAQARERRPRPSEGSRFDRIRRKFGSETPRDRSCFDPQVMHEEVLMTALVLAHRAFAHHLRGHLRTAESLYREALAMLRRLGEHRAYAMFQRFYAQLLNITNPEACRAAVNLAVTASESVRQTDIAYHARCVAAHEAWQADPGNAAVRRYAVNQLSRALAHAATMDLYRLRIEAGLYLSRLKLDSGDHESALEHAAEALSVAARYGLSLRKISLRIAIGHILIRRGDPQSGAALIASAVETADRFGYQRAVEAAQKIRIAEGISG